MSVVRKVVSKTDKSLWQVFKEFDFDEKCECITSISGLILLYFVFIALIVCGFFVHWILGAFLVLVSCTLVPMGTLMFWDQLSDLFYEYMYEEHYTLEGIDKKE